MLILQYANLALRFLLELCALAALGVWGFQTDRGLLVKLGLGIGAPVLAALVWGTFIAPRAAVSVPVPVWLLLQLVIFGLAAAALAVGDHPRLALALVVAVLLNGVLMYVWRQ